MASWCCRQSGCPGARLSLSSNRVRTMVVSQRLTIFLSLCPLCLSSALFLGQVHQENNFLFCHWLAVAEAFESHLMFAQLQGSPLEVLCDVTCDVRAEVTQAGGRRLVDEASHKRVKATDICQCASRSEEAGP